MDELDWEEFKKATEPKKKTKQGAKKEIFPKKLEQPQIVEKQEAPPSPTSVSTFSNFVEKFSYREERNLKKGEVEIEGKLDLHGLFLEEAHQRTIQFIQQAFETGKRTVLVVTGKGTKGEGVIKSEFPHWLQEERLRSLIIRYTEAHGKHGGGGAYYIFIKKNR